MEGQYIPGTSCPDIRDIHFPEGARVKGKYGDEPFNGFIEKEHPYCVLCRDPETGMAICPPKQAFICGEVKLAP